MSVAKDGGRRRRYEVARRSNGCKETRGVNVAKRIKLTYLDASHPAYREGYSVGVGRLIKAEGEDVLWRRASRDDCGYCGLPLNAGELGCSACGVTHCPFCGEPQATPEHGYTPCEHFLTQHNDDGWQASPFTGCEPYQIPDEIWERALPDAELDEAFGALRPLVRRTSGVNAWVEDEVELWQALVSAISVRIEAVPWVVIPSAATSSGTDYFATNPAAARTETAALVARLNAGLQQLARLYADGAACGDDCRPDRNADHPA